MKINSKIETVNSINEFLQLKLERFLEKKHGVDRNYSIR